MEKREQKLTTASEQYSKAINLFFGMSPKYPYWLAFILYLRKENRLQIAANFDESAFNVLASINKSEGEAHLGKLIQVEWEITGRTNTVVLGIFSPDSKDHNLFKELMKIEHSSDANIFKDGRWEKGYLLEVAEALISLPDEWLRENFDNLFDDLLQRTAAIIRYRNDSMQPKELTNLAVKLLNYNGGIVYNPFAGFASYGLALNIGNNYIGEEINQETAAIAQLRFSARCTNPGKIHICDSFRSSVNHFDFAISTPPFMLKDGSAECHFLNYTARKARRTVGIYPMGFLFRRNERASGFLDTRKMLIENDLLDTVVYLPSNLNQYTSIATCLLLTNQEKKHKGYVKLVIASDCFLENGKIHTLEVNDILSLCEKTHVRERVRLIANNELAENDFNLSPHRYFNDEITIPEGYEYCTLSDLGKLSSHSKVNFQGAYVRIGDLASKVDLRERTAHDFTNDGNCHTGCILEENALILSEVRTLKPTLFNAKEGPIALLNCMAFIPNAQVLPAYLAIELTKEYITKQLPYRGVTMPRINRSSLLEVKVLVPPLEKQRQLIEEYQAELIKELGIEVQELKDSRFDTYEKNMHLRKHTLAQVMRELNSVSRRLNRFVENSDGTIDKDAVVAQNGTTFAQYLSKLYGNIQKSCLLVNSLTDEFTKEESTVFDFEDFFNEYKQSKLTENYFIESIFLYDVSLDDEEELSSRYTIRFSPKELTTVLDNIFTNAQNYGFTDEKRKDYCIRVEASLTQVDNQDFVSITIANNGELLPEGMTTEKMFNWGIGSHTGLGTWQTKNIVEAHGGQISFTQNEEANDGFCIEYKILLPLQEQE